MQLAITGCPQQWQKATQEQTMKGRKRLAVCRMALTGAAMLAMANLSSPGAAAAAGTSSQFASPPTDGADAVTGVGLVIGLQGTGDSKVDDGFVDSSIVGVLKRAGLDIWHGQITPGRVAMVMVVATLPGNPVDGAPLTVSVTAVGNAASLAGGTLLPTPLRDQNGNLYAVGQGRIEVDNRTARASDQPTQPQIETRNGLLSSGAVIDHDRLQLLAGE